MILRFGLTAGLLFGLVWSHLADASEVKSDNTTQRELIDFQSCDPVFHPFEYKYSVCPSKTGADLYFTNSGGVCSVSVNGAPEGKGIIEYRNTLCTGEVIWALAGEEPLAIAYNIQFTSDYSGADDGRWLIRSVADKHQTPCITHDIGGLGSRPFVEKALKAMSLPFDCDRAILTDVN